MTRAQRLEAAPSPSARQPQRNLPAPAAFKNPPHSGSVESWTSGVNCAR